MKKCRNAANLIISRRVLNPTYPEAHIGMPSNSTRHTFSVFKPGIFSIFQLNSLCNFCSIF